VRYRVHAVADSTADPALTVSRVSGQLADPFGRSPGARTAGQYAFISSNANIAFKAARR